MAGLPSFWAQFRGAHPPWLSANPIPVTYGDRGLIGPMEEIHMLECQVVGMEMSKYQYELAWEDIWARD